MARWWAYSAAAIIIAAIAIGVALLVVAPKRGAPPATTAATTTTTPAHRVVVTDVLGRRVAVKTPIERIAVLGAARGYIVALDAIGGPRAVKSIVALDSSAWRRASPGFYEEYTAKYPNLKRAVDVGSASMLRVDALLAAHPDVVLAPASEYKLLVKSGALARLEEAGVPVVFLDFSSSAARWVESVSILGKLLGAEGRASSLINLMRKELRFIEGRLEDITYRPRVLVLGGSLSRLVDYAGGVPVNATKDPQVVVVLMTRELGPTGSEGAAREALRRISSELANSSAARHYHVYGIYAALLRGVMLPVGLEFLVKSIHPGVFRDVRPQRDLARFFEEYLSVPMRGVYYAKLPPVEKLITVVDAAGRRVEVRVPVERIAVLYGLEDLVAVAGEDALAHLVALNKYRYEKWRPDWWVAWTTHFPWLANSSLVPDVGQPGINLNLEALIASKPDVVIVADFMYKRMLESGAIAKLEAAHIPVVVIEFVPRSSHVNVTEDLEVVKRSIMVLGEITGYTDRARELWRFYEHQFWLVVNRTERIPPAERPKVIVFATWAPWRVYGAKSMYNEWITLAGGVNVAAKVVPGFSGDVDPEFVLKVNPDVIVFTCNNNFYTKGGSKQWVVIGYTARNVTLAKEALRMLIDRPGWSSLKAVREGRVYIIHHGLSHGHIFQFATLQWLAKWLHPNLFRDLDPLGNLKEFYAKFMPYPLKGVWAVGIRDP